MSIYEENSNIKKEYKDKMRSAKARKFWLKVRITVIMGLIILVSILIFKQFTGNKTFFDTTYTFDYAIIQLPNGEIVEGNVKQWNDYEGDQLQVIFKETGKVYLTDSTHCVLIKN